MDEDATWYASRPRRRRHCIRRVHSAPRKGHSTRPSFRPMSIVATVAHLSYCWALVVLVFSVTIFCLVPCGRLSWLCQLLGARKCSASYRIVDISLQPDDAFCMIGLVVSSNQQCKRDVHRLNATRAQKSKRLAVHYTDVARMQVQHSNMLSRSWNVTARAKPAFIGKI